MYLQFQLLRRLNKAGRPLEHQAQGQSQKQSQTPSQEEKNGGREDGRSERETHMFLSLVLGTSAPATTHTLASVSQQLAASVVRY